jgi:hypothetical protein
VNGCDCLPDIRLLNTDRHGGNILVKANRSRTNSREDVLSDEGDGMTSSFHLYLLSYLL